VRSGRIQHAGRLVSECERQSLVECVPVIGNDPHGNSIHACLIKRARSIRAFTTPPDVIHFGVRSLLFLGICADLYRICVDLIPVYQLHFGIGQAPYRVGGRRAFALFVNVVLVRRRKDAFTGLQGIRHVLPRA
jgi:hypothetical protein